MSNRKKNGRRVGVSLAELCALLQDLAPLGLAAEWDNVGLLAGDHGARVRRALLCIDLMPAVVEEANAERVELVYAYHPPIFRPISRLHAHGAGMDAAVHRCIAHGIAIYSPHTALDVARGGTNDVLASLCGAEDTVPIEPRPEDPRIGFGRVGLLAHPCKLGTLARRLGRRAGATCVYIVGPPEQQVRRALVAVGAAGSLPLGLELGRGDVVVTGELRHHDALLFLRLGSAAIALSHWSSERPTLAHWARRIEERAAVVALVSEADQEPFARG
jgi:dinuclear metal center YbgI/SA1388 family protein